MEVQMKPQRCPYTPNHNGHNENPWYGGVAEDPHHFHGTGEKSLKSYSLNVNFLRPFVLHFLFFDIENRLFSSRMGVAHTFNPSSWKAEAGGSL